MKALSIILLLITQFHLVNAQDNIQISGDLSASRIAGDVYMITHVFPRYGSNCLLVMLPERKAVLIDTPHETSGTKDLVDWIYKTFGKTELTAIITGWHQDNLGGNEYLRSLGVDIYGPELTARLINQNGEELKSMLFESTKDLDDRRYYNSYKNLILTPPNKIFNIEAGLSLTIGEEKFEVYFPGESHTIDNTVVYIHSRKFLFGGCMVFSANRQGPGFIEHANMEDWPGSVEKVARRFPDADVVIPGHGPTGDFSLLNHTVEVLNRYNESNSE